MIVNSLEYHQEEISSIGLYQVHWHGLISIRGIRWVTIIRSMENHHYMHDLNEEEDFDFDRNKCPFIFVRETINLDAI